MTAIDVTGPQGVILDRDYTYDLAGGGVLPLDKGPNLDRIVDSRDAAESRLFFYDELDRLWKAMDLSGTPLFTYLYDAAGNRTQQTTGAGMTTSAYTPGSDKLASASGAGAKQYAHDAYGSRIYADSAAYAGSQRYVYDESQRLVRVREPGTGFVRGDYVHDAFGRRVQKTASGKPTVYVYDLAGHLLEIVEPNADPAQNDYARDVVWLEDELVGIVDLYTPVGFAQSGGAFVRWRMRTPPPAPIVAILVAGGMLVIATTTRRRLPRAAAATIAAAAFGASVACDGPAGPKFFWIHGDHLGTPLAVTDTPLAPASPSNTKTVWRASYEPFGKATPNEDADGDGSVFYLDFRFPGQLADAESGLHYNYFRTYDPTTGRYLEADPIGQGGDINQYAFVRGRPTILVDAFALEARLACYRCRNALGPMICLLQEDGDLIGAVPTNGGENHASDDPRDPYGPNGPLPPGEYTVMNAYSPKFKRVLPSPSNSGVAGVINTPAGSRRSGLRLHSGRYSEGCVTLGRLPFGQRAEEARRSFVDRNRASGGTTLFIEEIQCNVCCENR